MSLIAAIIERRRDRQFAARARRDAQNFPEAMAAERAGVDVGSAQWARAHTRHDGVISTLPRRPAMITDLTIRTVVAMHRRRGELPSRRTLRRLRRDRDYQRRYWPVTHAGACRRGDRVADERQIGLT